MTDRELLDRYLAGDVSAFEAIIDRYENPLLRFVARYRQGYRRASLNDGALEWARDTVQEVFLRFLEEARGTRASRDSVPIQNISAWLYRVARNLAIDEARKEIRMERRHRLVAREDVHGPPPSDEERREVAGIVSEKLHGLPPNQRDVLILKIQEGKSYREIAAITGLSTSNVGYLVHHGLKALASELRTAGIV